MIVKYIDGTEGENGPEFIVPDNVNLEQAMKDNPGPFSFLDWLNNNGKRLYPDITVRVDWTTNKVYDGSTR